MPRFVNCDICGKIVTPHSLTIHRAKCVELWRIENAKLPPAKRSSTPVDPNAPAVDELDLSATFNPNSAESDRPATVTLSSTQNRLTTGGHRKTTPSDTSEEFASTPVVPNTRVCYICGQRVGRNSVDLHERRCHQMWLAQCENLPKFIRVSMPQKLRPPSIDGTFDNGRLDQLASQSAHKCQRAECLKCRKFISIGGAVEHGRECRGDPQKGKAQKSPIDHYLENHSA